MIYQSTVTGCTLRKMPLLSCTGSFAKMEGGGSGLKPAFNLSRSYHRLQVCIRWFMQVYYAGVSVVSYFGPVSLGSNIYARQIFGVKWPTQFRHWWAERNPLHHYYTDSQPNSRLPNSCPAQTFQFLRLWCDVVGDRTPASHTPSGRSNH